MKNIKLLLLFVLPILTIMSCDNEPLDGEFGTSSNSNLLLGEWFAVSFDATTYTTSSFNGMVINSESIVVGSELDYTVIFDETTFTTSGDYVMTATAYMNGVQSGPFVESFQNVNGNGEYTVEGNTLSTNDAFFNLEIGGVETSEIAGPQTATFLITNNGNTLTISQNQETVENVEGLDVVIEIVSTTVWQRTQDNNPGVTACDEATTEANAAAAAYNANSGDTTLCNAYISALESKITACGDPNGTIQATIDGLDCSQEQSTGVLKVTAGTLPIDFITRSATLSNGVITVTGSNTEQGANYHIYFEVTENETGVDVMQNFILTLSGSDYAPNTDGFDDFTSTITMSSGGQITGTFGGIVTGVSNGADLNLSQGEVDLAY
ncbi:MAG: hypothetical protein GYB39_03005 [Algicola sp.]|nr:hypothetical protein [Algicola sp.]